MANRLTGVDWFATQVRVGHEQSAAHRLTVRGYEVFLPSVVEQRRWSDRVKRFSRPLFAGYVFCRTSADAVAKIVSTPGVIRIVGDGTRPLAVAASEIESIRRIVSAGAVAEPWPFLESGTRVRIDDGPLRGTEGVVVDSVAGPRVVVSISLLQRSVAVAIAAVWVRPEARGTVG